MGTDGASLEWVVLDGMGCDGVEGEVVCGGMELGSG